MDRFAIKGITGKLLLTAIVLLLAPAIARAATGCDGAGNCYVYATATGSGNGSSWTNACTGFTGTCASSSLTRGVTYWIAAGNYGGVTFSAPDSGSQVITIEGATTSSHGPATDWNNTFAGQALFSESAITTDYWTFNGQTRGADWQSGYTIKFWNQTDGSGSALQLGNGSTPVTNITLEYIEAMGTNTQGASYSDEGVGALPYANNAYIGYSWIHNVGSDNLSFNEYNGNLLTLEYDWISYNHMGLNSTHSQCIQSTMASMMIRYSVWQDCQSSGAITDAAAGTAPITDWEIYGNIFFWDAAWNSTWYGNGAVDYDDGIVGLFSVSNSTGVVNFYNNTIAGLNLASNQNCNGWAAYITPPTPAPTVTVENNIWYNFNAACVGGAGNIGTFDYNGYYTVAAGDSDSGAHSYNGGSSTNPFVNPTANTIAGFALAADTHAGLSLSSSLPSGCTVGVNCYNIDLLGVTRGADGTWDIGAEQIPSSTRPNPPTNLTSTPH